MDKDLKIAIIIAVLVFLAAIIFLALNEKKPKLSPENIYEKDNAFGSEMTYVEFLPDEKDGESKITPLIIYGKIGGTTINLTLFIALFLLILIIVYRVRYHSRMEMAGMKTEKNRSFYKSF